VFSRYIQLLDVSNFKTILAIYHNFVNPGKTVCWADIFVTSYVAVALLFCTVVLDVDILNPAGTVPGRI